MAESPPGKTVEADVEELIAENKSRSIWQIIRYPIGIALIGFYFYVKLLQKHQPPTLPYDNAAQAGGGQMSGILIIWLIFYVFISRKNGPLLNLIAPAFAVTSMWVITDYL